MERVSHALLGHLHSIFDPDPAPILALRVRHPQGARWSIEGDILTLHAGHQPSVWDLNDYSLGSLAAALQDAGFEVAYLYPAISHLSALTLLEGSGDQEQSNGDHLNIFTAPLVVMLAALGQALGEGRAAIAAALAQLILPNATNEWADRFGEIFGIPRRGTVQDSPYLDLAQLIAHYNPIGTSGHEYSLHAAWEVFFGNLLGLPRTSGESAQHYHDRLIYDALQRLALGLPDLELDAAYTARIIEEVKRSRSSPAAILRNIRRLTGQELALREPWQEVHYLSQSALSGLDHLQGAPIYEYHRMQLVARRGLDWLPVLREAEADRPAGTILLPPFTRPDPVNIAGLAAHWQLSLGAVTHYARNIPVNRWSRLSDDLNLSDYFPPPSIWVLPCQYQMFYTDGLRGPYHSADASFAWEGVWDERPWSPAAAVPVEMYPPKETEQNERLLESGAVRLLESGGYRKLEKQP